MKPEQQRIAIAEACGWTDVKGTKGVHPKARFKGCGYADDWIALPDYLNDLNAMAEAEKTLSWKDEGPATSQRRRYLMNLEAVISGPPNRFGERPNRTLSVPFATAAQRAEAFLRTIGKWENDK